MPKAWSAKDERQYKHILKSCKHGEKTCKRIAAATVNKTRAKQGRTKKAALGKVRASQFGCRIVKTTTTKKKVRYIIECDAPGTKPKKKKTRRKKK